jgi:hypothetical protein
VCNLNEPRVCIGIHGSLLARDVDGSRVGLDINSSRRDAGIDHTLVCLDERHSHNRRRQYDFSDPGTNRYRSASTSRRTISRCNDSTSRARCTNCTRFAECTEYDISDRDEIASARGRPCGGCDLRADRRGRTRCIGCRYCCCCTLTNTRCRTLCGCTPNGLVLSEAASNTIGRTNSRSRPCGWRDCRANCRGRAGPRRRSDSSRGNASNRLRASCRACRRCSSVRLRAVCCGRSRTTGCRCSSISLRACSCSRTARTCACCCERQSVRRLRSPSQTRLPLPWPRQFEHLHLKPCQSQ